MLISEIFHSIQGEGLLLGVPSVFVRTSGCNLRCRWCDTPYASWNPEGETMTLAAIVAQVKAYDCPHVVLTGGEPMIASGIRELAAALRTEGLHITIETAGTVAPEGIACDLASLSPKLANSTPDLEQAGAWQERHEATRYQPELIRSWLESYPCQLKFVVSAVEDLPEIESLLAEVGGLNSGVPTPLAPSGAASQSNLPLTRSLPLGSPSSGCAAAQSIQAVPTAMYSPVGGFSLNS